MKDNSNLNSKIIYNILYIITFWSIKLNDSLFLYIYMYKYRTRYLRLLISFMNHTQFHCFNAYGLNFFFIFYRLHRNMILQRLIKLNLTKTTWSCCFLCFISLHISIYFLALKNGKLRMDFFNILSVSLQLISIVLS